MQPGVDNITRIARIEALGGGGWGGDSAVDRNK